MSIGIIIKESRIKAGFTQEDLAIKTGISERTIQRIESCKVEPRQYTMKAIKSVLEIDNNRINDCYNGKTNYNQSSIWIPLIHLSGILLPIISPIIIWLCLKNKISDIKEHSIDAINFQISMMLYILISCLLLLVVIGLPLIIIMSIYNILIILINTLKVLGNKPYKYPLSLKIIRQ